MKQNKQKALERLREIENEVNDCKGNYIFWAYNEEVSFEKRNKEMDKVCKKVNKVLKEAQKIKDDWKDGCGKEFILGTEVNSKGEFKRDIKEICGNCDEDYEIMFLCSTCKAQNKEKDEICGRILG